MRRSAAGAPGVFFAALIRTHHVTSRKKLQRVRKAATQLAVPYVLVRSGGAPGIMYAEAESEAGVADWVAAVQGLRYKDFQCVQKPGSVTYGDGGGGGEIAVTERDLSAAPGASSSPPPRSSFKGAAVFEEVTSTTEFAARMQERGLLAWFKQGMGYI